MIKSLKYSAIATMLAFSGCSCVGPISRQPYSIKRTNSGYDVGTTFWGFRLGKRAGAEPATKQNDSKKDSK